jgi:hypothetical protein
MPRALPTESSGRRGRHRVCNGMCVVCACVHVGGCVVYMCADSSLYDFYLASLRLSTCTLTHVPVSESQWHCQWLRTETRTFKLKPGPSLAVTDSDARPPHYPSTAQHTCTQHTPHTTHTIHTVTRDPRVGWGPHHAHCHDATQ